MANDSDRSARGLTPGSSTGLGAWRLSTNHNRMIDFQKASLSDPAAPGDVALAFFASSAFRITSPAGITVMIDPWRNLPTGKWDWYFHDFPMTAVDIGVSTHAHFDHDALDRLDASVLLDRLIGTYQFGDLRITGVADKHAIDARHATYDMKLINTYFGGQKLDPPDNARSWDNCMILVETGGLRILHWGDNRHDVADDVLAKLGRVDILLMPVDDSQHVMGNGWVADVIARIAPRTVVPHHYYTWNVVQRQSTLLTAEKWLSEQERVRRLDSAEVHYRSDALAADMTIDFFGDHIAFDVDAWHASNGLSVGSR